MSEHKHTHEPVAWMDRWGELSYAKPPIDPEALYSQHVIDEAVRQEREGCAAAVEYHSGFGDPTTIETCAELVRARGQEPDECIHVTKDRYDQLLAAETSDAITGKAVLSLVIAAREFWDTHSDTSAESDALDKALRPFSSIVPYENEPDWNCETKDAGWVATGYDLRKLADDDSVISFGLEAQGHIPTIKAALGEDADWREIGRRIGWDGETAKQYYERYLARAALSSTEGTEG